MAIIRVDRAGLVGLVADPGPTELPPEAWTDLRNVRLRDESVENVYGYQKFSTPATSPYLLLPYESGAVAGFIYCGVGSSANSLIHTYISDLHTDITTNVAITATAEAGWTGTTLGTLPVLNPRLQDYPKWWDGVNNVQEVDYDASTTWADENWRAGTIRAIRQFLVAGYMDEDGILYPHRVRWSHPADGGTMPSTWDETDTTKVAGFYDLAGSDAPIVDIVQLADFGVVYKADAVFLMQYVGFPNIWGFPLAFREADLISTNCVVQVARHTHFAFGATDIYTHNGRDANSILRRRTRRWLYNQIDPGLLTRCFAFFNVVYNELWFCFPVVGGSGECDLALVHHLDDNTQTVVELNGAQAAAAGTGQLSDPTEVWNSSTGTWETDVAVWDADVAISARNKVVVGFDTALSLLDSGDYKFNESGFTAYVERKGLTLVGQDRAGNPIVDVTRRKVVRHIWPRLDAPAGTQFTVKVGGQARMDEAPVWVTTKTFTVGSQRRLDVYVNTLIPAVRFECNEAVAWKFHGFDIDIELRARY